VFDSVLSGDYLRSAVPGVRESDSKKHSVFSLILTCGVFNRVSPLLPDLGQEGGANDFMSARPAATKRTAAGKRLTKVVSRSARC
jgi:hypothetical protein